MRASQVTSDSTRHCESTAFTMWCTPDRRDSSAPGPPEITSSGTRSAYAAAIGFTMLLPPAP